MLCLFLITLQHPWMTSVTTNKPVRDLVIEAKADVFEEIEDLPPDQLPVS